MTPQPAPTRHGLRPPAALILLWFLATGPVPAQGPGGPPPVSVASPVEREITEWDEYTGRFEAAEYVEIRARVSGYLKSIGFADGQQVTRGQLLYVIDPAPLQAAVDRARATLTSAERQAELARIELARVEKLIASNTVSREDLDTRRASYDISQAAADSARAELRAAELELSFTRITSPVAGRVSYSRVDVGNLISGGAAGATLLTTVVSIDPIHFVFDVNESDYLNYRRINGNGARPSPDNPLGPVFVRLLDESGWTRQGRIEFVDNAFDAATGTLRIRAVFDNPEGLLLPNVFGRLRVASRRPYPALLIDPRAVLADQSAKIVMTLDPDDIVRPRPVRLGPVLDDGLQVVREGLSADDRLIVSGLLRARPGSPVTPQPVEMARAGVPATGAETPAAQRQQPAGD